jgi:carboxyl-terminal processing protease
MSPISRKRPGILWLILSALLVCLVLLISPARAAGPKEGSSPAVKSGLTTEQRQKNVESFELVWKTVRDNHYDPKLGGVDWPSVRAELRPRVEKANSMDEARGVMNDMLRRLGHSHVGVFPASLYEDRQGGSVNGKARHDAVPGFEVRVADGEAVVVRVAEGLPAARAGVRPGWRLRKIDGEALAPVLARIRQAMKGSSAVPTEQASAVEWRLRGEEGKEMAVTFLDGSDREVTLSLRLARPRGTRVQLGQGPPRYVHFESRRVDNEIAYFSLNCFYDVPRVMKAFGETVQDNLKAPGFVLDLRGNPGGLIVLYMGIGSWFADRPDLRLGTAISRTGSHHYALSPREDATYEGPLAILVDEMSASMSEILAGGLQGLKRARIFGTRTAGAALPSDFIRLPNGDGLQYVTADYVSVSGQRLEGNGVQPDEVVPVDRRALLAGRDPTLDAAVRWIRSQEATRNQTASRGR